MKNFYNIQNSSKVNSNVNQMSKRKAAKSSSAFDFSRPSTNIPHDKLMRLLNEISDSDLKWRGVLDIVLLFIVLELSGQDQRVNLEDLTLSHK